MAHHPKRATGLFATLLCLLLIGGLYTTAFAAAPDRDGDGFTKVDDCNDNDPAINPAATELCTGGVDEDCDGFIDCADSGCASDPACVACVPSAEVCNDGLDNDCDSATDCADSDCTSDPACSGPGGGQETMPKNQFNIMMNYELGMHCTGFEFAYCCVLPPYNSIIAQVVKTEKGGGKPILLEGDPNVGLDVLSRQTVVRDHALDANGNFKKYVLRYWHDAQPRNDGRGAPQASTLISLVEGNSLLMWNTVFDAATTDANGALVTGSYDGSTGVLQGDGSSATTGLFGFSIDNYWNAVWNHLYIYVDAANPTPVGPNLEGHGNTAQEADKIRLGIHVDYAENEGAALQPMGPGVPGHGFGNVLTFSGETGTVVYTQMKVLEDLPVMLTSPRLWEALGLPLTPFEDTIDFFGDPGAVDEDSVRPYVAMKAQLHNYDSAAQFGIGTPVLDGGNPVIGFGTAPIDIPNCERCHALANGDSVNSAQNGNPAIDALVQAEYNFWMTELGIGPADSDWYPRLKSAAISILGLHDAQHGTSFTANYDPNSLDGNASTRLGHETVICQRCHADNVIAVVKSADCGVGQNCDVNDPRNQLYSQIAPGSMLIKPLTEAIHNNHKNNPFSDSLGRNGGCQGCHPAHRSDGDMRNYPITETGLNAFVGSDNRDAAGGCYVGRDVHSNRNKDADGVGTPSHLNAAGQWLVDNVVADTGTWKGIWCTNCHSQLGQELWKAENMSDLVHGVGDNNPRAAATLADMAAAVGVSEAQAMAWLDPKNDADTAAIWNEDPGMCNHAASLLGLAPASPYQDGNVATIEINLIAPENCTTGIGLPGPDCFGTGSPSFFICGSGDGDAGGAIPGLGDVNVALMDFCTTSDCVAEAQSTLDGSVSYNGPPSPQTLVVGGLGQIAVPVPFSAATDGRDHWLSAGEPHCADCHAAPYVEQSGNITAFPPFNYPRKASLFRYTRGHQDITCQGCHESIHGLYPSASIINADGVEVVIDTTTYAQAASMNTDDSHGPLKCGACHNANGAGVNKVAADLEYNGQTIGQDFDAAVSWQHTFTDEADVRDYLCLRCHVDNRSLISSTNGKWTTHAKSGRVSRKSMDKAEILQLGHVAGDPAVEDPFTTVCTSCHGNRVNTLSRKGCTTRWKDHLIEGRASEAVWEYVSETVIGDTCGW